jgi:hypothetical protein
MTTPVFPNPFGLPELAATISQTATAVTAGINAAGHLYVSGLYGTGTAPVVAAGAGAGAGATIGTQLGFDLGGSFIVTTAGSPAAGAIATVTFGTALTAAPACILLNGWDQTAGTPVGVSFGISSVSKTGFTVSGPALTTAHAVLVNYFVLLQQA